jgi:hypothetical protein
MRHGRAKAARKTLQFFRRTHGFAPPYHVLLDGTFVVSILRFKIPLLDRLRSVLQGEPFHLYVTRSTLMELSTLQQAHQLAKNREDKAALFEEAYKWAVANATVLEAEGEGGSSDAPDESKGKNAGEKSTTHSGARQSKDVPTAEAEGDDSNSSEEEGAPSGRGNRVAISAAGREMLRLVTAASTTASVSLSSSLSSSGLAGKSNAPTPRHSDPPHRPKPYLFASQDEDLLDAVRSAGCAPVVRLAHNSVLLLEHPSRAAQSLAAHSERHKWSASSAVLSEPERELVRLVKEKTRLASKEEGAAKSKGGSDPAAANANSSSRRPNQYQQRKVKKARGPNPLSCRKKDSHPRGDDSAASRSQDGPKDELDRPSKRRRRNK